MNESKSKIYAKIILFAFIGGFGGAIPYLALNFFTNTLIGPLYLLVGFSAYSLYLYFVDQREKNALYMLFVILGILLSIVFSQTIFFSFDPNFTNGLAGNAFDKATKIISNNLMIYFTAIGLYFIISLLGLLITYILFKMLKISSPTNKERMKKNARKKF